MNEVEIIRHRQMEGLTLFVNTVEHRTPHSHPEWELLWLLDGGLTVSCGPQTVSLVPGQMILFAPSEIHEFQKTAVSGTFLCLQLSPQLFPSLPVLVLQQRCPHQVLEESRMEALRRSLAAAAQSYFAAAPRYELFCLGQCSLVLHTLLTALESRALTREEAAAADRRNARLERILRYVDENYMRKPSLAQLAQQEDCSLSYLSHFIRRTTNMSFQELVAAVRFNSASRLIIDTDMRLLDICVAAGFSDYRYFSRAFRRQYGLTPEEYRHSGKADCRDTAVRRSLHSVERIYSPQESSTLLQRFGPVL